MDKKQKGLFVLFEGINSTIFNSQVVEHVSKLNNFDFEIVSFNTYRNLWKTSIDNKKKISLTHEKIKIHLVKSINIFYPFAFLIHAIQFIVFLKKNKNKYSFIHSRADYTQFIVLITKFFHNLNSVWDCRGDQISEIKFALEKKNIIYKLYGFFYIVPLFKFIRYLNSIKSRKVIFVSDLLKNTILKIKNKVPKTYIIPCLVNESLFYFNPKLRKIMRKKYDIKLNQNVFVYSGSMVAYQSFDIHKNLYKKILNDKNNLLFFLTNDTAKAHIFFSQFESKNVIIKSVNFSRINDYYNLSDFAILIRNNNHLNKVASPTKFGEYCMSGLPVIMNKNVQQCYENSLLIGNYIDIDNLNFTKSNFKKRMLISKKSRDFYSRTKFFESYKKLYKNLSFKNE